MSQCSWWTTRNVACRRDSDVVLGGLRICWQHYEKLADNLAYALTRPSGADLLARLRPIVAEFDRDRRRADEARCRKGLVYFVEREGFIKIGYSTVLVGRLAELARGANSIAGMTVGPVRLLATMAGDKRKERDLHARFESLRVGGEWFRPNAALWRYIGGLKGCVERDLCRESSRAPRQRERISSN